MAVIITSRDKPGCDKFFAEWAGKRIPHVGSGEQFGKYVSIGVATGYEKTDRLLAVIVFHDYYPQYGHCQISVAAADPRWATRKTIRAALSVPFLQYKCHKVWVSIPQPSERTIRFAKAIGFTQEGMLKAHYGPGVSAVILRMMEQDYDRIYWPKRQPQMKAA